MLVELRLTFLPFFSTFILFFSLFYLSPLLFIKTFQSFLKSFSFSSLFIRSFGTLFLFPFSPLLQFDFSFFHSSTSPSPPSLAHSSLLLKRNNKVQTFYNRSIV